MKAFLGSISVAALLIASPAVASDIYGGSGGSIKDGAVATPAIGHGGFYATGLLGYAWGDNDLSNSVSREHGKFKDMKNVLKHYDKDEDGALSDEEIAKIAEHYEGEKYNLGSDGLTIPFFSDAFSNSKNDSFSSLVYGFELSYLLHNGGPFGLEFAAGWRGFADTKTKLSYSDHGSKVTYSKWDDEAVGEESRAPLQSGEASAELNSAIPLLLRGYWFINNRTAVTLAGGAAIGFAELCGSNSGPEGSKTPGTNFCDDDTSIGAMGEVGIKHWYTDRIALTARADVMAFDFDAHGSASTKYDDNKDGRGHYYSSSQSVSAEPTVWSVMFGASIKLD